MQGEHNNAEKHNVIFAFQLPGCFFFQLNAPGTVLACILDEVAG